MVERTNPVSSNNPVSNKQRFLNEMPRLLDTMQEISSLMILNSEEDESSTDSPNHWTYPHIPYIKQLFDLLVDQGFYEPHIKMAKPKSTKDYIQNWDSNTCCTKLQVHLSFSICTTPPTKLDFINALGFVMPLQEEEEKPDFSGAPREWFQMVADKMAQGCPH